MIVDHDQSIRKYVLPRLAPCARLTPNMTAGTEIRSELRPGDLEAIVALHGRLYPVEYGVDSAFVTHVEARVAEAVAAGFPRERDAVRILERRGELVGSLALTDEGEDTACLRWFLIDPELRGLGLGRRLVAELIEEARERRYRQLRLETFSDLRVAAEIYRDAGFELVSEETGPRWGREITYQHYQLELQESSNTRRASSSASTRRSISSGVV
jgi:ribosomal protein S18 acetylase RimI-like enzyme